MIDILTPLAEATCKNCGGKITQYRGGSVRLGARWSHETNGKETCPGAPTAWPAEDTLVDLTSRGSEQ